jgi:hypothetical protein
MTVNTLPAAVFFKDFTTTVAASATATLRPANPYRNGLTFQCKNSDIWYSYTNSAPSAGGTGCFYLAAGTMYDSGTLVPANAVYVFSVAGGQISCVES